MAIGGEPFTLGISILDPKESHMKTIHPIGLARLIATRQPFDLIDVRTKEELDKAHIPGARSIPLPELLAPKVLRDRKLSATEPLYVICRSRVLAGLASGTLEGAGCGNAVVSTAGWKPGRRKVFRSCAENGSRKLHSMFRCWLWLLGLGSVSVSLFTKSSSSCR